VKYNASNKKLAIAPDNVEALFAVNEVLKEPLFEIGELPLDEIKIIESDLAEDYY